MKDYNKYKFLHFEGLNHSMYSLLESLFQ
jgi:hypothetical protein